MAWVTESLRKFDNESYQQSHASVHRFWYINRPCYMHNANSDLVFNTSKPSKADAVDFIAYFIRMSDEE